MRYPRSFLNNSLNSDSFIFMKLVNSAYNKASDSIAVATAEIFRT